MDYEALERLSDDLEGKVNTPDYAILVYSVCGPDDHACGWQGWLLEGAFQRLPVKDFTQSGTGDRSLPSVTQQVCPNCNKTLYRTGVSYEFDLGKKKVVWALSEDGSWSRITI